MSSSALLCPAAPRPSRTGGVRFAVTWQHPQTRLHRPVGLLTCDDEGYAFRYLQRAAGTEGFRLFLGFGDLTRVYRSRQLFPLFAQRVMRASRPDYPRYLQALWLPADAHAWQILARSHGQREGDGIRLFLEPRVDDDGGTESEFLVHGVRHVLQRDPQAAAVLDALTVGQHLELRPEPDNPVDERAVLVLRGGGPSLGYVPMALRDWARLLLDDGRSSVEVVHVNGPEVPAGYRLLVRVRGHVSPHLQPFGGSDWLPAS